MDLGPVFYPFDEQRIVFQSEVMREIDDLLPSVAKSAAHVLIQGESGTGKELIARLIHARSPQSQGPFVAVNCASIPESLLESELFGYEKGAFTGASQRRMGLLQEAQGGTLLLDEIGEMPLPLQAKLLRVLEDRAVRPIGGTGTKQVNFRLISSTNCDLEKAVTLGQFRRDLYYRLDVISLKIPPLRKRPEDILCLLQEFSRFYAQKHGIPQPEFSPTAIDILLRWHWPGNVRELKNLIERTVVLWPHQGESGILRIAAERDLERSALPFHAISALPTVQTLVQQYIFHVLEHVGYHQAKAAKILGLSRRTLYRKLHDAKLAGAASARDREQIIH